MNKDEEMQKFLESEAAYLRALADILDLHYHSFSRQGYRDAMMGVVDTMRNRADKMDALLDKVGR